MSAAWSRQATLTKRGQTPLRRNCMTAGEVRSFQADVHVNILQLGERRFRKFGCGGWQPSQSRIKITTGTRLRPKMQRFAEPQVRTYHITCRYCREARPLLGYPCHFQLHFPATGKRLRHDLHQAALGSVNTGLVVALKLRIMHLRLHGLVVQAFSTLEVEPTIFLAAYPTF